MATIVTIKNWRRFNPRKDVKSPSWFRLDHNLFDTPDFCEFSGPELLAWIYILSIASKKNSDTVEINFTHSERFARVKKKDLLSSLKKLEALQIVHVDVTDTSRGRNERVTDSHATDRQTDITNTTDTTDSTRTERASRTPLVEIWNSHRGDLSEVKGCSGKRLAAAEARWEVNPSTEYWSEVVTRLAASDFCHGKNDRGWRADFDFLIRPDTHHKVMEGKYDNRQGGGGGQVVSKEILELRRQLEQELKNGSA